MWKQGSQLTAAVLLALGTLSSALPTQSVQPSDMLLLTGPEKRLAWRDLHRADNTSV